MSRVFSGATDRVQVTQYAAINNLTTLTYAAWCYRTGDGGSNLGRFAVKSGGAGTEWFLFNNLASSATEFQANRWSTTAGIWRASQVAVNDWHHTAVTYSFSATANNAVIYADGVAASTSRTQAPVGTANTVTTVDLTIGNQPGGSPDRHWAGRFQHVALWNRILAAGEIMGVYRYGPTRFASGLVLYLPMWGTDSPEPNHAPQNDATQNGAVTGAAIAANVRAYHPV